jgi:flagellar hook-basal body complex protein FliE
MKDVTVQSRLQALGMDSLAKKPKAESDLKTEGPKFNEVLKKAITEVSGIEKEADKAIQDLVAGGETNIHEAMIALQKADVSFKVLMTVRDKILSAYQEVMRLQV